MDVIQKDNRIEELQEILRANHIPLPEEREMTERKQEELLQKQAVRLEMCHFMNRKKKRKLL